MRPSVTIFQTFLAKFDELKSKLRSEPQNIVWRSREDPALAQLAADVAELDEEIERLSARHGQRYVAHAPRTFGMLYREYNEKFREHVIKVAGPVREERRRRTLEEFNRALWEADGSVNTSALNTFTNLVEQLPFDLAEDDGARIRKAIDDAIFGLEAWKDYDGPFEDNLADAGRALKAWEFLNNEMGFDISALFLRWKAVRTVFVPAHVSNFHGETEANSLYAKLRDATRAYACGCFLASIAMCRSIMETTIERHYIIDATTLPDRPRIVDKIDCSTLSEIDKERFKKLMTTANKVLHQDGALSQDIEAQTSGFLFALKRLIEEAPARTA